MQREMAERGLSGHQLEAQLLRLPARDVDGLPRGGVAGGDRPHHVMTGRQAQGRAKRRVRRLDAVDLDHGLHVGADLHEGDERPLLGPDSLGLLPLLGSQLGGALEQGVEGVDRLDGALQLGVDEPDVEQRRGIAGQLVGPLELDESAGVLPLVEEAQAPIEALRRLLPGRRRERGRLGARPAADEHHAKSDRNE